MTAPSTRFTTGALRAQLLALGVRPGGVLVVHTSFRAVRGDCRDGVLGGPPTLLRALRDALGESGTLVMPTMTDGASPFDPTKTPTCDMGVVAETFWRTPGTLRSTHPGASFAASGPLATIICADQPLSPPHGPDSPIGRVHDLDGQVLLLGVHHSENTTIHLAEALAGAPYSVSHPCVVVPPDTGTPETILIPETDHCCENFRALGGWLRAAQLQREGPVGHAHAILCDARDVVQTATARLAADPLVFLCLPEDACVECDRARASIPAH